jgi:hypothetical protein
MEPVWEVADALSVEGTHFVVDALATFGLGLVLVFTLWLRRHALRDAAEARSLEATANAPLRPGPATIVGHVDGGAGDAFVTIELAQRRQKVQKSNGGGYVEWRETSRRVEARPFYVKRQNGERVRVEPDERVFLVDRLDGQGGQEGQEDQAGGAGLERRRTATLRTGERVCVTGVLVPGIDPLQGATATPGRRSSSSRRRASACSSRRSRSPSGTRSARRRSAIWPSPPASCSRSCTVSSSRACTTCGSAARCPRSSSG